MGKVIQIGDKKHKVSATLRDLARQLDGVSDEEVDAIKNYVILEARMMLGLTDVEVEEVDDFEPVFFDDLWDVWAEANENCYFCSDMVDPNEEEYGEVRGMCLSCAQKVDSFLRNRRKKCSSSSS